MFIKSKFEVMSIEAMIKTVIVEKNHILLLKLVFIRTEVCVLLDCQDEYNALLKLFFT